MGGSGDLVEGGVGGGDVGSDGRADARASVAPTATTRVPGVDVPDRRGRTNLHLTGRDLTGNLRVRVRDVRLLTSNWYITRTTEIEYQHRDGHWSVEERETYDRGNGATILLYDAARRTVLLIRQFRYPAYVNGHPDGMLLETPAGLLDEDDPETAIRREAREETGYAIGEVTRVFDAYMSPGSITEKLFFFAAPYDAGDRADAGGGLADEGEDIELVELGIDAALARIGDDIVDAKTIMLLQWAALRGPFAR
ncbi:NUDIX domain-containing protein [Herbiconiux sp. VKM Ac-2851]|nr:NUDIX domain-containing protein [Herbiconiux sp. VKM Ac-2851]NQX35364.1 NUDIX domain-containing protein [Herbiconiux sp. VKM Ac-2851]